MKMLEKVKNKLIIVVICVITIGICVGVVAYNNNPSARLNNLI